MVLPQQNKRGFPLRRIAFIAVLALLAFAAWYVTRPQPLPVALWKVERGVVEATVSNTRAGTIKACQRAKLAPPAGGQISQLTVKKGQRVVAGQILLELWNDDLRAQERLAREQLSTAQTQAQQACMQADLAEKEAERARQLKERGFISAEGLDQKASAAKVNRAGCDAARSQIEQSRSRIAVARANLDRMVLRAPFDGVVADISGELGEYATPSPPGIPTPPAIDLIDDRCLFVSAPIDEVDAANIKAGQASRIILDAIKGKSFAGKVKRVAPYVLELEKQARTVEVEVEFVELPKTENLLVGYSADVEIVHTSRDNVLRIPTQALLEGKRVLVYRPADGVLEERTVTTGLANWEHTEITSGLKEGDQIVMSLDQAGVKAGAHVQPEASKPAK
ncbi:MAG: efflux RND transporter periplasmic adaptor subunit [Betaproteobacteria bacterium]|nr:efflux RND transporter periplasmic adaptor subunit [Betaproteobacteria bacterium]MDE2310294.1 efflux RND transporter periplasmic adaptor subunit [Betaproteobacteria bacterium]